MNRLTMINTQIARIFLGTFLLTVTFLVLELRLFSGQVYSWFITLCFLSFVFFEYLRSNHTFIFYPPTLFCVYMLFNIFIAGIAYFNLGLDVGTQFVVAEYYLLYGMWITFLSVVVIWISFYFFSDRPLKIPKGLRITSIPSSVAITLLGISVFISLLAISQGAFGYVVDQNSVAFASLINFSGRLSYLSIIILALYHFEQKKKLIYWVIGITVIFGIISASKTNVVYPMVVFIIARFIAGEKIRASWLFMFISLIFIAYALVEPFRIYYELIGQYEDKSIYTLIMQFFEAANNEAVQAKVVEIDFLSKFINRLSYLTVLGKTIEFTSINGLQNFNDFYHLAMSPLYGAVPRIIWEGKPLADFGLWASENIFNLRSITHTGITSQGYSYLIFGVPGVILFSCLYGSIHRFIFNAFFLNRGMTLVFLYFYLFVSLPSYPTWTATAGLVQNLILVSVTLFFVKVVSLKVRIFT